MKITRLVALMGLGLSLSACASIDTPTRNAPFETLPTGVVAAPEGFELTQPQPQGNEVATRAAVVLDDEAPAATRAPSVEAGRNAMVTVKSLVVHVPRSLKVSEANRFLPAGDIVWRGDPRGDRHQQVQRIFEMAMLQGVAGLRGPIDATLEIEVTKFHSLTEKARYITGGVHAISFRMALKDPETGQLLAPPREVTADLEAYGGRKAIQAEERGETMKVRITDHLSHVIIEELTTVEGHQNAELGLIQMLNKI